MSDVKVPQMNQIVIAGNLVKDPKRIETQSGKTLLKLCIANTRYFRRNGETDKDTCFVDIDYWQNYPDKYVDSLVKGSPVLVSGNLKQESWDDKDTGKPRSKLMVNAGKIESLSWGNDPSESIVGGTVESNAIHDAPATEDDIPF